jgi:geranylgeranyl diphosphate synthase type II
MIDIMDAALRRGHTTVHEKWDLNTEFYLRDAMLVGLSILRKLSAQECLGNWRSFFSKTALQVCRRVSNGMSILRPETT